MLSSQLEILKSDELCCMVEKHEQGSITSLNASLPEPFSVNLGVVLFSL